MRLGSGKGRLEDLENFQPTYTGKNEKVYSGCGRTTLDPINLSEARNEDEIIQEWSVEDPLV